ncbi:S-layer homology domain-containing protein [Cohnella sp. WQ 127256]|uniref:S-layer homology domain-containing protein n=1 Tax=Cohnella sp. WQ 127256 TaxID=2938790 RepID=UPI002117770F|nr:S-layer homology domain-containing protein [Cohnella sp. WQ 127256]
MRMMCKKGMSIILVLMMVIGGMSGLLTPEGKAYATVSFAGGTGQAGNPYQIATADQLNEVRNNLSSGIYFVLTADIDLSSYTNWEPIGRSTPFFGNIDGKGFKIMNLTINRPENDYIGLIGKTASSARITNIILENFNVTGRYSVGGLVGFNYALISSSYASGSINGNTQLGGLVGENYGTISNSYASGSVNGNNPKGGLVGQDYVANGPIYTLPIDIAGVTAPVTGATPVLTLDTSAYTATINWSQPDTTFAGDTKYTATITLVPKSKYIVEGVPANFFTVAGAVTTNAASSGVVTAVFPKTAATPISSSAITGVTAPVKGATPVTTIADTAEYTATIDWSPVAATFAANTAYTATITITPKAGYTLTGVSKDIFTVAGATTTTNDADSGVITAVFPATAAAPISSSAITGVTVPVKGATPVTTIADTAEYTATIDWSPVAATFAANTAYTATITITPKAGYTLTGIAKDFFTVAGATTTTNDADSGVITAVFPATAAAPISSSAITGVTVPVKGATPVTTLADTAEYTATIAWSPVAATFAANTPYTATITITPKAGYTLTSVAKDFFTVAGATTTTNDADSGVITAVFPATAAAPISSSAITGVTVPVKGATPVTTLADTAEYTATIAWSPVAATFAANTPYTATITITPKAGYTLTSVAKDFFTVAGATTTTNDADSGVITAVFPATAIASSGGGGSTATPTPTDGKINLPSGKPGEVSLVKEVIVTIPANATSKDLKLTIDKVLDSQNLLTTKDVLASSIFEILKNFPENFSKPVTLTFKFDPTKLSNKQRPAVFYYDEVKKIWVEVNGGKISGNQITIEVNHFTKFAVFVVGEEVKEVPTETTKPTTSLTDISGHWAEANIKKAVNSGIVKGYSDASFKPNATVTRAEFAVMLMNALKPQVEGTALTFTDTSKIGAWAQKAVAQAVQADIIKGNNDGTFRPNAEVTRAEMAVMIARAMSLSSEGNTVTGFADDKNIPTWAKGAVAAMKKLNLVEGKGTNQFDPTAPATRAEAVTILLKMLAQQNS